ncbi:MAG: pyridoxine 5'-phosphate synthase [Bacteroidales bacterium]|nr:pyridoxine 5'-phosphate synthase [Bacteroidales bacterium]
MTKLSVNINKIATIRNARGGNVPDVVKAAINIEKFGADGITVHPRPDERHIKYQDVYDLKEVITTELNIEGYPSRSFLDLVGAVKPAQATLVPDPPDALTSNAGWDTIKNESFLKEVISELQSKGIRTSIFTDTTPKIIENAAKIGTNRIELYTEPYATNYSIDPKKAVHLFTEAAKIAHQCGLGINAGHDLNLDNLKFFIQQVPHVDEVSIGHALISDALYFGLQNVVLMYKNLLK